MITHVDRQILGNFKSEAVAKRYASDVPTIDGWITEFARIQNNSEWPFQVSRVRSR